jgi:phosphoglycolate phosphatase
MKYQVLIFDFDGTLADSYPWFLSIYDDLAERFQLPHLEKSELMELRSVDINRILKERKISPVKAVIIGTYLKQLMSSQIERVLLVDGMQSVIDTLVDQQVKLAVVSSNAEQNVRQVLGSQNATNFVDFECGVSLLGKTSKFLNILRKIGIQADQALCIGDEIRDLKSSRQAGIAFGAVSWGYTDAEMLRKHAPDFIFTHPTEIIKAVLNGSV